MAIAVMPLALPSQAKPRAVMEKENSGPEILNRRQERRLGEGLDSCFDFMVLARVSTCAHLNAVDFLKCEVFLFIHRSRISTVENPHFPKLIHPYRPQA